MASAARDESGGAQFGAHAGADASGAMARALLDAVIDRAGFDGWTKATVRLAEKDTAMAAGSGDLFFPGGLVEMIDVWAGQCDDVAAARLAARSTNGDLAAMKIRERVTFGVRCRLEAIEDQRREAARRAAARLVFPDGAKTAAQITWRAADMIWRGIGDRSTDANFYTKRATLSGVIASVLPVWLAAEGPDDDAPWQALDRRIENVMQFEKFKAQVSGLTDRLPNFADALVKLRYPRG